VSDGEDPADLYERTRDAADAPYAQATPLLELARCLERLTQDTPPTTPEVRGPVDLDAAPVTEVGGLRGTS
jgi:hypothetical protein